VVTVEESNTFGTELEFTEGMQFDKGYLSPYFVTDPSVRRPCSRTLHPLRHHGKISSCRTCCRARAVMQAGKPLLIVAEDVEGEALATLVVNKIRGTFNSVAVKAPGFGDRRKAMLQDMATLTGGQVIAEEVGLKLENTTLDLLGSARASSSPRTTPPSSTAPVRLRRRRGPHQPDQGRDRQTPTPTGTARSSRSASPSWPAAWRHQGRRRHRGRAQGEEAPHRGRRLGHPRGHRGGHRRRWRHRPLRARAKVAEASESSRATSAPARRRVEGRSRPPPG
jgi:hypothetical protein